MADNVFRYGDFEKEFDFTDFAYLRRVDTALGCLESIKAPEAYSKKLMGMTGIEATECAYYEALNMFNAFAEDNTAAEKALNGSTSLDKAMDLVNAFTAFKNGIDESNAERWKKSVSKYQPNREQRRAAKK